MQGIAQTLSKENKTRVGESGWTPDPPLPLHGIPNKGCIKSRTAAILSLHNTEQAAQPASLAGANWRQQSQASMGLPTSDYGDFMCINRVTVGSISHSSWARRWGYLYTLRKGLHLASKLDLLCANARWSRMKLAPEVQLFRPPFLKSCNLHTLIHITLNPVTPLSASTDSKWRKLVATP